MKKMFVWWIMVVSCSMHAMESAKQESSSRAMKVAYSRGKNKKNPRPKMVWRPVRKNENKPAKSDSGKQFSFGLGDTDSGLFSSRPQGVSQNDQRAPDVGSGDKDQEAWVHPLCFSPGYREAMLFVVTSSYPRLPVLFPGQQG